jgi:hypothetical protein
VVHGFHVLAWVSDRRAVTSVAGSSCTDVLVPLSTRVDLAASDRNDVSFVRVEQVWDPESATLLHVLMGHQTYVKSMVLVEEQDGRMLLMSGDEEGSVGFWAMGEAIPQGAVLLPAHKRG